MSNGQHGRSDDTGDGPVSELPVVLYSSPDGRVVVNALVKDETLWMT